MSGSWRTLSHTADTGIQVEADTLGELFEWSAAGMFGLMFDLAALTPRAVFRLTVEAAKPDDLLFELLAELLYRIEVGEGAPCRFTCVDCTPAGITMDVGTAPLGNADLVGPPIKAVTYHELSVEQQPDGSWAARVVFDV